MCVYMCMCVDMFIYAHIYAYVFLYVHYLFFLLASTAWSQADLLKTRHCFQFFGIYPNLIIVFYSYSSNIFFCWGQLLTKIWFLYYLFGFNDLYVFYLETAGFNDVCVARVTTDDVKSQRYVGGCFVKDDVREVTENRNEYDVILIQKML